MGYWSSSPYWADLLRSSRQWISFVSGCRHPHDDLGVSRDERGLCRSEGETARVIATEAAAPAKVFATINPDTRAIN